MSSQEDMELSSVEEDQGSQASRQETEEGEGPLMEGQMQGLNACL